MASTLNASLAVDAVLDYNLHRYQSTPFYSGNVNAQSVTCLNNVHRSQPHRHSHSHSHLSLNAHKSQQNSIANLSNSNHHLQAQQHHHQQQQQRLSFQASQKASSTKDLTESQNGTIKTAQIILLDGRKLYFSIQTRLFAGDLFDMIAKSFNLKEKEYFGLAFINETGTFSWLNLDKRVVEHEFPSSKKNQNSFLSKNENITNLGEKNSSIKSFEEIQTLNRSSSRKIGDLKRKNQALKSKKVTSSLINLNSVQNKLKQKFNSSGMLGKVMQNNTLETNQISDCSLTAPNSQFNSRNSSIASVNDLDLDPIYHEVPFDNSSQDHGSFAGHDDDNNQQSADIVLYFMVKYFVESVRLLSDNVTIQLFYLQAKSLFINEYIQVSSDLASELGALILQITYGDSSNFSIEKTQSRIQKWRLISNQIESTERSQIEKQIIDAYGRLEKSTRGECIYRFMTLIEKEPTYGVHYFEALENKTRQLVWLGFSNKGILQFDYSDRSLPVRQFSWKHLENLYFRERKFSIEVRDAKRVVLALSSINLYENAIEEIDHLDDLSSAICDPTTQVSVSRRTFGPINVTVYVWFATNCQLTKCMWSMAVAQHQFYTERHSQKCNQPTLRTDDEIIHSLDNDKCHLIFSRNNWSKRKSLSSKASSNHNYSTSQYHYSSLCSVSSSRASSISGSLSNLSDSSSSSLSSEFQNFSSEIALKMSRNFKSTDRNRNLISRKLKLLEMQLCEKLQEIDKLDRLENQLLRKAKSQTNLHQNRPRLQDYLEVVSSNTYPQQPHNRASISSNSSSGTSGTSGGPQTMLNNGNNFSGSGRPLKSSHSISSTNSLRNFVVTGRSSVAGSVVSNNSTENVQTNIPPIKKLPPLPNFQNNNTTHSLPPPPPPPTAPPTSNISQILTNQLQMKNSTSQESSKNKTIKNLPTFTSPYVDRFEKSVQEEGLNLYSVPNRRTSIAMNSFDDFFMKTTVPKFQSTTSLDVGNSFPNGITSAKSSNIFTDTNSVIYETVTYSTAGSNPSSRIGSRTNLSSSQHINSSFSPALVESSVDDECDGMSSNRNSYTSGNTSISEKNQYEDINIKAKQIADTFQYNHVREFFRNSLGTLDEQNFMTYRSAFIDRNQIDSRLPEELIGYSSRSSEMSSGDCQIPIMNRTASKNEPTSYEPKIYSKTFSQHSPKSNKGWVETELDFPTGNVRSDSQKNDISIQAKPLIVQSQRIATFMPKSVALQHVTHESDSLVEPIESSVDDVRTEDTIDNHYQEFTSNIPTPSPSPPNDVQRDVPLQVPFEHSNRSSPVCFSKNSTESLQSTPLTSNQIQNSVSSYITNSEPSSAMTKLSQFYQSAALLHSQKSNSPVQYHAAPVIVERNQPTPLQTQIINPSSSVPASVSVSPSSSSVPSPIGFKRNSAALLSPTESVMSFMSSNGPFSPISTVAFVPANINTQPINTTANGTFSPGSEQSIPVASCKGNIVEVDVVTVGQFQPGYEEEKPFTMDDFFKYSQKYKNSKAAAEDKVNKQLTGQIEQLSINRQQ